MSDKDVIVKIGADGKPLNKELGETKGKLRKFGQVAGKELKDTFKGAFGTFAGMLGVDGLHGLIGKGQDAMEFEKRLTRMRINAKAGVGEINNLRKSIFETAQTNGLDPDEILGAAEKYVERTGDLAGFKSILQTVGDVASATGSSIEDVTAISASLGTAFGISGDQMMGTFDSIAHGANIGSVELKNMATLLPTLSSYMARFGAQGASAANQLQALMQMSMKGYASPDEAATGMKAAMDSIIRNADKLKKYKVNVFDDNGNARDLWAILQEIGASKELSNIANLQKSLGGRGEALSWIRAVLAENKKTGESAVQQFNELADTAKSAGTIAKAATEWKASDPAKVERAMASIKETFNKVVVEHAGKIASAIELAAKALGFAASHAKSLVVILTGAKIMSIIAKLTAGGKGLSGGLQSAANAAGGAGGGGGGGKVGKVAGGIGLIAAAASGYEFGQMIAPSVREFIGWSTDAERDAIEERRKDSVRSENGIKRFDGYGGDIATRAQFAADEFYRANGFEIEMNKKTGEQSATTKEYAQLQEIAARELAAYQERRQDGEAVKAGEEKGAELLALSQDPNGPDWAKGLVQLLAVANAKMSEFGLPSLDTGDAGDRRGP